MNSTCGRMIRLKVFKDGAALTDAVVALLRAQFGPSPDGVARAVMLAGGSTPMAAYEKIAASPFPVDPNLRILFSDDRHVPPDSPKSNFGNTLPMFRALNIPDDRVARVRGELPLADSVERYESDLRTLLDSGCRVSLGLLGLGADGHTASLFSAANIAEAALEPKVCWIDCAPVGQSVEIVVFISPRPQTGNDWPGRNAMQTQLVGWLPLDGGGSVCVVHRLCEQIENELPQIPEFKYFTGKTEDDLLSSNRALMWGKSNDGSVIFQESPIVVTKNQDT